MGSKKLKEKPVAEQADNQESTDHEDQKAQNAVDDLKEEVLKPMDGVRITSAALNGYDLKVSWTEVKNGTTSNYQKKTDSLVHMDLVNAFAKLGPHLALICETKESVDFLVHVKQSDDNDFEVSKWPEDLQMLAKKIDVQGLTFAGEYSDKVTIAGSKELEKGRHALNTPSIDLSSESTHPYQYKDELSLALDACLYEIKEFVFNNKTAFKQLDMFEEGE